MQKRFENIRCVIEDFKYSIREKLSGDLVLPTYTFAGACYKKVENTST
jgi:hypothetical protein